MQFTQERKSKQAKGRKHMQCLLLLTHPFFVKKSKACNALLTQQTFFPYPHITIMKRG
jgi:hypothetical protein